jgi:WhiB family redox-sensing transcriptional regulator
VSLDDIDVGEQEWRLDAACLNVSDPDVFFPARGASSKAAKAMCRRCRVRDACLSFALEGGIPYGIWGGLSPDQRRKLGSAA